MSEHSQWATTTITAFGGSFVFSGQSASEYIFKAIASAGSFYELDLLRAISYLPLRPGGRIVDVGASLGNHTVFFAGVLGRQVTAVEPFSGNVELLRQNIRSNGLEDRVDLREAAFGEGDGFISLTQRTPGNSGTYFTTPSESGGVPVRRLDDAVPDPVALIKIDTEGDEAAVLRGALATLERDLPFLCIESHDGRAYREVADVLEPLGYTPIDIGGVSDNYLFGHPSALADGALDGLSRLMRLRSARQSSREILARVSSAARTPGPPAADPERERLEKRLSQSEFHVVNLSARNEELLGRLEELEAVRDMWKADYGRIMRNPVLRAKRLAHRAAAKTRLVPARGPLNLDKRDRDYLRKVRKSRPSRTFTPGAMTPAAHVPFLGPDTVRIGIASIPRRAEGLKRVLGALYDQADQICVYLNGYDEVPSWLRGDSRIAVYGGPNLGDRGKFRFLDGFSGFYLTVDDDIDYPSFYVDSCLDGIERYGRKAAVGWHGSRILDNFQDYYSSKSRKVHMFGREIEQDTPVHILGTGCTAFHTSTISLSMHDFPLPNMADVFFAMRAQAQRVPLITLAHQADWAKPLELAGDESISGASMKGADSSLNVRKETNSRVKSITWRIHRAEPVFQRPPLSVAVIGRVNQDIWKKGGIVKSTHLIHDALARFGADVRRFEISGADPGLFGDFDPQIVMIYPGDPERPDFAKVEETIDAQAGAGRTVLINLSLNLRPERTRYIRDRMLALDARFPGRVRALVFSDRVLDQPELADIGHLVLALPKTLDVGAADRAVFADSEGVFLGDYAKLCDEHLLAKPIEEWLAAIRAALPGVPIYAVDQYQPRVEKNLDVIRLPYLKDDFGARLSRMRVMVNPFRYCTFEMVPMEVAALGVPVIYRTMEQSLSEYLGMGGVEVESPQELASTLPHLYADPTIWRLQAEAGLRRSRSTDTRLLSAQMYLRLLGLVTDRPSAPPPAVIAAHATTTP